MINESKNLNVDEDYDCPVAIINSKKDALHFKCENCDLIPNFTLFNYEEIQLNIICDEEHSNQLNLDYYIKKILKSNKKECNCSKCNEKLNFCQFCKQLFCKKCIPNHFTVEHVFRNEILNVFSNEMSEIKNGDINDIKEEINKGISSLRSIEEYFKEIETNFSNFMIKNLNGLLFMKLLLKDYLILKEENSKYTQNLFKNIKYLSSFNELTLKKNEFNDFLKDKKNNILKGSDYNEKEMNYFTGKYIGNIKNGIREGEGKFIYTNKDIYEGKWENDVKEGKGIMKYNNGNEYNGEWKNNKKEGKGIMIFKNGDKLETEWNKNKIGNKVKYYYKNGDIYDGEYKKDKKEGKE